MTASVEQQGFQKPRRGQEGSQGPREERKKGPSEGGRTELAVRHTQQPWRAARSWSCTQNQPMCTLCSSGDHCRPHEQPGGEEGQLGCAVQCTDSSGAGVRMTLLLEGFNEGLGLSPAWWMRGM